MKNAYNINIESIAKKFNNKKIDMIKYINNTYKLSLNTSKSIVDEYYNALTKPKKGFFSSLFTNSVNKKIDTDNKLQSTRIYDMDSLEGINSIPVPPVNYSTGNDLKDCIYYVLQRKATEHKKNKRMDLAIACLRKSNEISDYYSKPLLMEKDYYRLIKYLEYDKQFDTAKIEAEKLKIKHPEFYDKRIGNKQRTQETIAKAKKYNCDTVFITTNSHCPICSQYNNKTFSISGKNKKYMKLPVEFVSNGGFDKDCIIGISLHLQL